MGPVPSADLSTPEQSPDDDELAAELRTDAELSAADDELF